MINRILCYLVLLSVLPTFGILAAKTAGPASLDDLLGRIEQGWQRDQGDSRAREANFLAERDKQNEVLSQAKSKLRTLEQRSEALERQFQANELQITELEENLRLSLGNMGELFGVIRQVAGDTHAQLENSVVTAEFPDRMTVLRDLATSKATPTIEQLRRLWYVLTHQMSQSGKVSRFDATVLSADGQTREAQVVRVGVFNAVSDGKYLQWLPEVQKLAELGRQPAARYRSTAADLESAQGGEMVRFAIDPSRGSILSLLVQAPSLRERLQFGGVIGYIIIALGVVALLVALYRAVDLLSIARKVRLQQSIREPQGDNPLGRIMSVLDGHRDANTETLELKLDEAIMREQSGIDRLLWLVKVVSGAAPLLGLLGTVTGMIQTFQAITLFGTGDPKLMAGGISEALVTTMLGLVVAIPLVLLHSWLRTMSKRLVELLAEQSMGYVAVRAEREHHGRVAA